MNATLKNIAETVRPYQNKAIRDIYEALGRGNNKILRLPTGAGKTYIAAAIIAHANSKGRKVLFIVDRLTLLSQSVQAFADLGIYASVIQGDNSTYQYGDDVVVASAQTLENWKQWPDVQLVIQDECHDQRKAIQAKMESWNLVKWLGMTATPYTTGLGNHWTEVVDGPGVRDLIEHGYLAEFEAWGIPPDVSKVKTTAGDYNTKELAEAVNNVELTGSIVKHYLEHAAERQGLIFAVDIAHSKAIAARMTAAGIRTEHIDCYSEDDHKYETIRDFRKGRIQCLTSVTILAKGFDVPQVGCVVLARPTKSLSLFLQQVGRGLRTAPGKENCIILDHAGNCARFGLPDDDFTRPLCTKKKGVSGSDGVEKKEALPKECPKCTLLKPAGVHECPNCGFAPERQSDVTEKDTKLVQLRGTKNKTVPKENKQDIYSQLIGLAQQRGYSEGWVSHKYRAIFDCWPRGLSEVPAPAGEQLRNWITSQNIAWAKRKDK